MSEIDQALRLGKWPTDRLLARELEVTDRTIPRDLEFMRDDSSSGGLTTTTAIIATWGQHFG
jgi:hypothetical protein